MKYQSANAFRRALENQLGEISKETDMPHSRLRKLIAFDRFLVRLLHLQPDSWVLKGGFALQLRLGDRARTTKDIDLLALEQGLEIFPALQTAGGLDMGDWFTFQITPSDKPAQEGARVTRYKIRSRLDGRIFEEFHIDIGVGDPVIGSLDYLETTDILEFANLEPACVPCYPVSQQIAEKLHAYTHIYGSGPSSRVKDFFDLLLLAELGQINGKELSAAILATFKNAGHLVPGEFTPPPRDWRQPYQRTASSLGLVDVTFDQAYELIKKFLDPILEGNEDKGGWNPAKWRWE